MIKSAADHFTTYLAYNKISHIDDTHTAASLRTVRHGFFNVIGWDSLLFHALSPKP